MYRYEICLSVKFNIILSFCKAFAPLSDDDYELAMRRVREILDLDFEQEAAKPNANEIIWGVFMAFTKY